MTQILGNEKQGLSFEIVSARISDGNDEKKHVVYTLQVRFISGSFDITPSFIERRYTHFLNLYDDLKKESPQLLANVSFPKKVIRGNFDNDLISNRSTGFETLLKYISTEPILRNSNALLVFLQDVELTKAKQLLQRQDYQNALPLLENIFILLNKVFTDRSPAVLIALCRLLGCSVAIPGSSNTHKWADLALHRYDGVSDSDLLELYVPLLQVCVKVWWQNGRNKDELEERLRNLQRRGIKVNENVCLMEAVNNVEIKIFEKDIL